MLAFQKYQFSNIIHLLSHFTLLLHRVSKFFFHDFNPVGHDSITILLNTISSDLIEHGIVTFYFVEKIYKYNPWNILQCETTDYRLVLPWQQLVGDNCFSGGQLF